MDTIYLDNNATTRPADAVADALDHATRHLWANPSSVHRQGQQVRQQVELARSAVASLLGCREREIVFTSGGTEANNLAIRGAIPWLIKPGGKPPSLITSDIEHAAIRAPAEALRDAGGHVVFLKGEDGVLRPGDLRSALTARPDATTLVSLQWANNETGVIQPIAELVAVAREFPGVMFHTDATQAVGKIPVDFTASGVDLLTFSGHKFHGPKGVGALLVRSGVKLRPQNLGGPQERERRGGTENAPAIIALGVAATLASEFVASQSWTGVAAMREAFESWIIAELSRDPGMRVSVNSGSASRLWNTTNLAFPRLEAEAILLGLSERGVAASAGAACSSGSLEPSPVLLAMGIAPEFAHGSIRFSLSRFTTRNEIDRAAEIVVQVVRRLAKTLPV